MWSLNDVSEFELREGFGFFFFFGLVNLFTLEQIFAVVKIRHSSLILKEVLLIFTNKPQDGGEES